MNILIITPRIPYPPYRGDKLKIFNIAKILSQNNSVKILTFYRNSKQFDDLINFDKYGIKITAVKLSVWESFFHALTAVFFNYPFQVAWFKSSKMKNEVEIILNKEKFDVIYYHLIRSAQYLNLSVINHRQLNVIDYTDAVSLYLNRFAEIEKNPIKRLFIKVEQKRVEKYEKIAEKFHTLFICSEIDKKFLQRKGMNAQIQILNNGVDVGYFNSTISKFEEKRIIFTGNMPYYANYDAAIYFVNDIFPEIIKSVPEAEFFIVGQKPPNKIKSLAGKNIFVTGFVKDIKAEYLKSAVNVAPMRFGAGTLNKVIESIALGVPVVASSIAVAGLPTKLNKYVFIADEPKKFAETVVRIINNPNIRTDIMEEGKKVLTELLSWEKIVGQFETYLAGELSKVNKI